MSDAPGATTLEFKTLGTWILVDLAKLKSHGFRFAAISLYTRALTLATPHTFETLSGLVVSLNIP